MKLQNFKNKGVCCLFFLSFIASSLSYSKTEEELISIGEKAFKARSKALSEGREAVGVFRKGFDGLSDKQILQAVALHIFALDSDPEWEMTSSLRWIPANALGPDPEFVTDWTALREMLRSEEDPRRFYLLTAMKPFSTKEHPMDFIADEVHMLFRSGPVAKDEGEYTKSYSHDVSLFAYQRILGALRVQGAEFTPPSDDVPHKERILILAKWLQKNWPGCEEISIYEKSLHRRREPRGPFNDKLPLGPFSGAEMARGNLDVSDTGSGKFLQNWILFVIAVFLLCCIVLRKWIFHSKRP